MSNRKAANVARKIFLFVFAQALKNSPAGGKFDQVALFFLNDVS